MSRELTGVAPTTFSTHFCPSREPPQNQSVSLTSNLLRKPAIYTRRLFCLHTLPHPL